MSEYIHKSHNVTVLIYHVVFPAKYRRVVFDEDVDSVVKEVCLEIEKRYQVKFLEIGSDKDHIHFLLQTVPTYSVTKIVTIIKSITAREVFARCPQVRKKLWGGEFWTDGYFANTVGRQGNESTIGNYVKKQGQKYHKLYQGRQLSLFYYYIPDHPANRASIHQKALPLSWQLRHRVLKQVHDTHCPGLESHHSSAQFPPV